MARDIVPIHAFNRGIISARGLGRTDLRQRVGLSAEIQTNYIPRTLGSMTIRPGWEYIAGSNNNKKAVYFPFIYAVDDLAYIEMTSGKMRVFVDDAPITRAPVSAAVTNSDFATDLSGWTDNDDSGGVSGYDTGQMSLQGNGNDYARMYQEVSIDTADESEEHAFRIVVNQGKVDITIGTSIGDDSLGEATLTKGTHSLAFTPGNSSVFIQAASLTPYPTLIEGISIESGGVFEIETLWSESDLANLRWDQSADVIFISADGYRQKKIERRGVRSWSLVEYLTEDGPFGNINLTPINLSASAITGAITLTASSAVFKSGDVGGLYRLSSVGQSVAADASGEGQWSDYIRVAGVDDTRKFTINVAGTWTATVTLQRSAGDPGNWVDVETYTSNQADVIYDDTFDNSIMFYRIGIDAGDYTSGTAELSLTYDTGSITGVVRVTAYTTPTSVEAIVLKNLGGTAATNDWFEGQWSPRRGYPTAVALHEGRLFWAGRSKVWGSVSDGFSSFDDEVDGDSGPLIRTIGSGPIDVINWIFAGNRLVLGTASAEAVIRSSSFDEPLAPSAFNIRFPSSQGSANVPAVKVDSTGVFVQRCGKELYRLVYDNVQTFDYNSQSMTELVPEILLPSCIRLAVQRQPDTRIHCVRSDGKVAVMIDDPVEEVSAWVLVETDGFVEDAFVMPGAEEDRVYYSVRREIGGETVRYLEKWALESECVGGTVSNIADSYKTYSGVSTDTITGLEHLEGKQVVVWGAGKALGTYTVASGSVTLSEAVTSCTIGLGYTAQYKTTKLDNASEASTALNQKKRVDQIGIIAQNLHHLGLQYGPDFDTLDYLPESENGEDVADDTIHVAYDEEAFEFNGDWDTDSRVCLQTVAPYPATILALTINQQTNERI